MKKGITQGITGVYLPLNGRVPYISQSDEQGNSISWGHNFTVSKRKTLTQSNLKGHATKQSTVQYKFKKYDQYT